MPNKNAGVTSLSKKQNQGLTYGIKIDHFTPSKDARPHFSGAYELIDSEEYGKEHNRSTYDKQDIVTVDGKDWGLTWLNKRQHRDEVDTLQHPDFLMDSRKAKEALADPNFGKQFIYSSVTLDEARKALREKRIKGYNAEPTEGELQPLLKR